MGAVPLSREREYSVSDWGGLVVPASRQRRWHLRHRDRYLAYLKRYHAKHRERWQKGGKYFKEYASR